MTTERRTIRTTLAAYRVGAGIAGWCCANCHRNFPHQGTNRKRTFALFTLHKALRHRCLLTALTGRRCVIRHRVQGSVVTMSWTIAGGAA